MKTRRTLIQSKGTALLKFFGTVVQRNKFPEGRKADCCPDKVRRGEPVIVVHPYIDGETRTVLLHGRCVAAALRDLPPDPRDTQSRYDRIRHTLMEAHKSE